MRNLILALTVIFTSFANAALTDVDRSEIVFKNILTNSGFESGKAGWSASGGSFSTVTSGSNLLTGKVSATWDSDGAGQTLTSAAITIPNGLYAQNGLAYCKIMVPSGTATHTLSVYDGSNTLVSQTITSSTTPTYTSVNFIFPSSGTVAIRLTSVEASSEPLIAIDDCYLGDAVNLSNISQASLVAQAYFAQTTNCTWDRANSAFGQPSDSDCPGITVVNSTITVDATDTNEPEINFSTLPPGLYLVTASATLNSSTTANAAMRITDGTTNGQDCTIDTSASTAKFVTCQMTFNYTSAAARSFKIETKISSGTLQLLNTTAGGATSFTVERFPTSTELAFTPDKHANSWSGYHADDCSWARTNTAYGDPAADSTCTFTQRSNQNFGTVTSALSGSDKLPGITFVPSRTGRYFVTVSVPFITGAAAHMGMKLTDGTNDIDYCQITTATSNVANTCVLTGIVVALSTSSITLKVQTASDTSSVTIREGVSTPNTGTVTEWSIFQIDQSLPMPVIANSVVSSASGVTRIEAADINCDASSTVTAQHGSWVSSVGNISSGSCAITLNAGIFSAAPYCQVSHKNDGDNSIWAVSAASSTSLTIRCETDAGVACGAGGNAYLTCVGAK